MVTSSGFPRKLLGVGGGGVGGGGQVLGRELVGEPSGASGWQEAVTPGESKG